MPGGTARATRGVLDGLQESGRFELVGVAARHAVDENEVVDLPIPVHHFAVPRPVLYEGWHRFGRFAVERQTGPVDLIWAGAMVVPPATVPTVVTVNDIDFLHHPEHLSSRGRTFFPRAWKVTLERAAAIVCPTQLVADDVTDAGADHNRVHVVPLGVAVPEVSDAEAEQTRHRLGLPKTFALWVGTLEPRKNLPALVAAMSEVKDLPLVVAGPDGWVIDGADVLAPLGSRVHRVGRVDEADLHALYRAASVFLLPSLAEGFGLPVVEAMAHGTPVVTSRGTATEEVAGGAALLVDPTKPFEIADAIQQVLNDPVVAKRLSEDGQRRAGALTWAAAGTGYADVFDSVLANTASGGGALPQ
ncbi:MAG: glycosyltransferase involved in cell wall biosynthesis [Acidimicrobiales bacterium]